jgi:hypothetical protein
VCLPDIPVTLTVAAGYIGFLFLLSCYTVRNLDK